MDYAGRYATGHARWIELLDGLPADLPIPSTPAWCLRELVAHLTGVAADIVRRNLDDWSLPEWTDAQVRDRSERSIPELLDEWAGHAATIAVEFVDLDASGIDESYGRMALVDLCGHEDDLREASGQEHTIDPLDWAIIGVHRQVILDFRVAESGLPPLRVVTPEGDDWTVGGSEAIGEVRLPRQELWRSTTGRRTRAAVRAYEWSVDPEPYVEGPWKNYTFAWPEDS